MANSPKRVAWDACAWIAHILKEKIQQPNGVVEDRGAMCRQVLAAAEKNILEVAVSAFSLAEVVAKGSGVEESVIRAYFDNDYILMVAVDTVVGDKARSLMLADHPGLKPPDSIYLATACITNADELHTFDRRLLALDGKIDKQDGTRLIIRKPAVPAPPAPLLEEIERGKTDEE